MSLNPVELMGTPDQLYHWVPGELVVVVRLPRRPPDGAQDALVEQVRNQLNVVLEPHGFVLEPYGSYGRWREMPSMPPVRRRCFIFGLQWQQPLAAIFFHVRFHDPAVRDAAPLSISYLQAHLEELAQAGLMLVSSMPNWLVTAAPTLYGEGGPALPPRPAPTLDLPTPGNPPVGWHVTFLNHGPMLDPNGADGATVAILDTAHHPDRLRSAATRPEYRRNWLLQRLATDLRSESGIFEVEYDRYPVTNDVCTGHDLSGESRYYFMPDHGMFVAGLVRDIAPRARVRVIRVLNDFGGGDLYNLFAALTDLEQELAAGAIRRLVINLSLTMMPDVRHLPYVWFDGRAWPTSQMAGAMRILANIEEGLRLLFESLYAQGALIVAAAGNDSARAIKEGKPPRPPRAPARHEHILGVSSVNSRFVPAQFANAANLPPCDTGVATFGGDGNGLTDANGLPDAVRGVYIAPTFPGGEQNVTGWADWCGSSFSTAIISAFGAHMMAQGWPNNGTMSRILGSAERQSDRLYGSRPDAPKLLANVIRVQQRFGM